MALNLSKILNVEKEESGVVTLLLLQSVFIGVFAGALDVGANALFLESYGSELIPRAFMFSGMAGIVLTSLYSFLQSRTGFRTFAIFNLLFVVLATAALRFGFEITASKKIVFLLFVMMGPLTIITMLGFWGTAGRFFTLRQGKRLFGIIDMGQVLGMILAFYAVPVLLTFSFRVLDTLLISLVSVLIALILQVYIGRRFSFKAPVSAPREKKSSGFTGLFRKKYTALMAVFVMLSVITAFFIHYSFLWATEANYPEGRAAASFLGAFMGTLMIFTIVFKSFLYGWLMKTYGLKVALLISPVLVLLLTAGASVVGGFFGYSAESASFTLFFLIIALSKLFNKALKDSMEVPSMKILYQSLDSRERYDIQARIDGTVNEITAFSAGLIMAGLAMLSFVHIIHFTYILIFVLAAWVFIGLALYRRYRLSLEESLTMARSEAKPLLRQQYFESLQEDQLQHTAGMLRINPFFIHHVARKGADPYLFSEDGEVRAEAWNMIANSLYRPDPEKTKKLLLQESDKAIRMIAESMLSRPLPSGRETGAALRSGTRETILGALESLAAEGRKDLIPQLISLLRDVDPFVRKAAIDAAGKLASIELGPYLVDYLGHPDLGYNAWSALVCSGEGVLGNLENAFHRSGQSTAVQIRIIHAMSAIGGPSAEAYLAQKLSYHQREVRHAVIKALHDSGYRPREDVRQPVLDAIYSSVAVGAWIIAAEQTIRENNPGNGLLEAIREELRFNNHQLFMLLGIAYDRQVVDHVKDSLTREESDDSGYAIELLNLIVDEQVKEYLEPYFDDRSAADKIRLLQNEFPVEILSFENLVEEILTRDGLWLGHYVRACAIDALGEEKRFMAGMQLAAQAFHPQRVISELSLRTLLKQAPETYRQIVERTGKPEEKEQEQLLNGSLLQPHPVMERMKELRNWDLFREVPWQELFFLAEIMEEANKEKIVDRNFVTFFRDLSTFESNDATGLLFFPDSDEQIRNEELAREKTGPGKPVYVVRVDLLKNMMFTYRGIHSAVMHFFETELETI